MNEREKLAEALGDIRVAGARQADWWTNDEDHALLIRVLRGECVPWAEGLIAAGWVSPETLAERVARERGAVLDEVERRIRSLLPAYPDDYADGIDRAADIVRDLRATTQDGEALADGRLIDASCPCGHDRDGGA